MCRIVRLYADADELATVFWDNFAVPSVALEAALVADHAEAVLDASCACRIYLTGSEEPARSSGRDGWREAGPPCWIRWVRPIPRAPGDGARGGFSGSWW